MPGEPLRSSKSLPAQLAATLSARIADGEWPPGTRLPSEHALTVEYRVSRSTVRTALRSLAEAGTVRVRHGAGTFVSPHSSAIHAGLQPLRSTSQLIEEQGHDCDIVFRRKELRTANATETAQLQRDIAPTVLAYERAFVCADAAVAFERGTIAADVFDAGVDVEELTGSIFDFLQPHGLLPDQAVTQIRSTYDEDVAWGRHRPDPPLYLTLDQVQFLPTGISLSWSVTHFVQANVQFQLVRTT